jgi:hypothetical protein
MKKSLLVIAFGVAVGYVLGARAGRERYEEIVERVNGVWRDPRVTRARREAAQYAREQAPVIAERAQAVARATPGAIADASKATAAAAAAAKDVAKDVADRATTLAKDTADRATTVAKDARKRTVSAATLAATRVGEARDDALEDFDDDK